MVQIFYVIYLVSNGPPSQPGHIIKVDSLGTKYYFYLGLCHLVFRNVEFRAELCW